jgi:serine---pyruvate transaminase
MPRRDDYWLVTPGPTPIPAEVVEAMSVPLLHHRGAEFKQIFAEVLESLGRVFRTRNDILVFAATGTGAMESAVTNVCSPGDRVVVVECGYFSARWRAIASAYGCDVVSLEYEWGETPQTAELASLLERTPDVHAVFLVHCESSSGVVLDVREMARAARKAGALVVVDAMSSLGAVPVETDAWGLDVVVASGAKSLMTPPGLAFAAVSDRAIEAARRSRAPRFYFDWEASLRMQRHEPPETAFSAATSLVVGLRTALDLFERDGLEARIARSAELARGCRAACRAMGLELLSPDRDEAAVMTAVKMPPGVSSSDVVAKMYERYGVVAVDGEQRLMGKIVRIGHIGAIDREHLERALESLEAVLADEGAGIAVGKAAPALRASLGEPTVVEVATAGAAPEI